VLVKVLAAWRAEGHKVLLFTQTQQMLDIVEKHVVEAGYSYHRMDGNTAIATRGRLMDEFNSNPDRCAPIPGLPLNVTITWCTQLVGCTAVVVVAPWCWVDGGGASSPGTDWAAARLRKART
jgi:hypothetical protein